MAPAAHSGLHERIALNGPDDEIKELADTFDAMIERLDTSFDGQRRFVANASHELRTPLTINRALLEVAVHRKSASPEIIALGETLLEINARHERLIDGLLLLTRSENAMTERSFVDLADIVEHWRRSCPRVGSRSRCEADEAPTTGDPVLLERVVQNLVENGLRHNVADAGWVRITTGTRDGSAEVVVTNTGPVIPRYEVPNLFEPFHRFGADRIAGGSPGAGLGLSIVQAVVKAHGGGVTAEPRDGGGLVVTVIAAGSRRQCQLSDGSCGNDAIKRERSWLAAQHPAPQGVRLRGDRVLGQRVDDVPAALGDLVAQLLSAPARRSRRRSAPRGNRPAARTAPRGRACPATRRARAVRRRCHQAVRAGTTPGRGRPTVVRDRRRTPVPDRLHGPAHSGRASATSASDGRLSTTPSTPSSLWSSSRTTVR